MLKRLTTTQLLVRGVLDVLTAEESAKQHQLRDMLYNKPYLVGVGKPEEKYKLWPRRNDRMVWPTAAEDIVPDYATDDHLYLEARAYFAASTREYVSEGGEIQPERMNALADALSTLFKLVVIDLEDNDDAQVIFEVLNGRQTPLSAIDLVKNLLFLRGELAADDVETLYEKYWAHFDGAWWKEEVGRGHAQRGRRDVLLSVWLTAETGKEASVGHLYAKARAYLNDGPSTEAVLRKLTAYSDAYEAIYSHAVVAEDGLRTAYERIQRLELATVVPLLAWLRTVPAATLSLPDHIRAVRAIESWALRRAFLGLQTRGYGTYLARVLSAAKSALETGADIADAVVDSLQRGALTWPTDREVVDGFRHNRYYGVIGQPRIALLLSAIDAHLRTNDPHQPDASIDYSNLQIEHVMPQSWEENWPIVLHGQLVANDESDVAWLTASEERGRAVNHLGNLTLVTGSFNGHLSNGPWLSKKDEFAKQNTLVINFPIATADVWDETHIDIRASNLAQVAIEIWPSGDFLRS
ncbi:HNH endonuclease family protein [Leifsonia sp. NPDC058248]|uniref:HNH endonuclease family protein n=1 Tax=Leifsonia sp. NPDC058248 TaxID=3346402 RepID=UPI0036DB70F9